MSPVATVIALGLALGQPPATTTPPPPPPVAPEPSGTPTVEPAPTVPPPTIPPPTIQPGTPKRVTMPGTKGEQVVLPTPVAPTPVKPTPVLPTGPQPILPGTDPEARDGGEPKTTDEPRPRRRRERRVRSSGSADTGGGNTGKCFAPQSRCRSFVLAGVATAASGLALGIGGAILVTRPVVPLREDPTRITSYRPPGAVMLGLGGGLLIAGVAVLASGLASHRRDQSMRRTAWWRPRVSVGVLLP